MERRAFLKLTALFAAGGCAPTRALPLLTAPGAPALSVFLIDDCVWVAAKSAAEALAWYRADGLCEPSDAPEVEEMELDSKMTWGEPGDPEAEKVTLAESIQRHHAEGVTFPNAIAWTDY